MATTLRPLYQKHATSNPMCSYRLLLLEEKSSHACWNRRRRGDLLVYRSPVPSNTRRYNDYYIMVLGAAYCYYCVGSNAVVRIWGMTARVGSAERFESFCNSSRVSRLPLLSPRPPSVFAVYVTMDKSLMFFQCWPMKRESVLNNGQDATRIMTFCPDENRQYQKNRTGYRASERRCNAVKAPEKIGNLL